MSTITTYEYLVFNPISRCVSNGTKEEIVNDLFSWKFVDRKLVARFKKSGGFKELIYHSYGKEFTNEEMRKDAIQFLFNELGKFGYKHFRDIGI